MAIDRETVIELGITNSEGRRGILEIHTSKSGSSGLYTTAQVYWVADHMKSYVLFQDFRKALVRSGITTRATQKNIDAQHATVTPELIASLTDEAKAFYAKETVSA